MKDLIIQVWKDGTRTMGLSKAGRMYEYHDGFNARWKMVAESPTVEGTPYVNPTASARSADASF